MLWEQRFPLTLSVQESLLWDEYTFLLEVGKGGSRAKFGITQLKLDPYIRHSLETRNTVSIFSEFNRQ